MLGLTYRLDAPRRLAGGGAAGGRAGADRAGLAGGRGRQVRRCEPGGRRGRGGRAAGDRPPRRGRSCCWRASAGGVVRPGGPAPRRGADAAGIGVFRIPPWAGAEGGDLPPVPALDAALKYLALMVLAAVAFVVAFVLLDRYRLEPEQTIRLKLVLGFLAVGLGLRLGAAPLHAWVGDLAAHTPPGGGGPGAGGAQRRNGLFLPPRSWSRTRCCCARTRWGATCC